jgi:hypothetical protein
MSWDQIAALRSRIGNLMSTPEISQSVGMDSLKKAYAGLSEDMRVAANQNGVGSAFDAANKASTADHAFIEGPLSKIIRTSNPILEQSSGVTRERAATNILNSSDSTIKAVRDYLPDAADQLAAFNLRQSALAKPSQAGAYNDTSTGSFLTNMIRQRQNTPGGYDAFYNNPTTPPGVRQAVTDLQTAAGALRQTEKAVNVSGTAPAWAWLTMAPAVIDRLAESKWGQAAAAAMGPPLMFSAAGKVMTNPALARYAGTPATPAQLPPALSGLLGNVAGLAGQ